MRWGWLLGAFLVVLAAGVARAAPPPIPPAFLHTPSALGMSHPGGSPVARPVGPLPLPPTPPSSALAPLKAATVTQAPGTQGTARPIAANPQAAAPVAAARPVKPTTMKPAPVRLANLPMVPYWESLRANKVYLRQGPGMQYPIRWVYRRRGLPVKVLRKFDVWRLVVDPAGDRGWIHEVLLSGVRSFMVTAKSVLLRAQPSNGARAVAMLEHGVTGKLRACPAGNWCRVVAGGHDGWVPRSAIYGVDPNEVVK